MAKVKYIKLADAVELMQKEKQAAERGFEKFGGASRFIQVVTYGWIITMLKELPAVEMEEPDA